MSCFTVYKHTNIKLGKVYIGITSMKPEKRWQNGAGYRKNRKFYEDILKYGWDGFTHEVLATDLTEEQAVAVEKELIKAYDSVNTGYNKSDGGKYVAKTSLNSTANQILASMIAHSEAHPQLSEFIDLFQEAETNGENSEMAKVINIHCDETVKYLERNGEPTRFNDEQWLAHFVYSLRRNILACQYFARFGTLKGFDVYPEYWDYMRAKLSGKGDVDAEIQRLEKLSLKG